MPKSSLSSVVSDLVRASMGSSVSNDVADEDLDRHVAELILREAKQKGERYSTDGIKAYLNSGTSDSNAPKTNKRFLSSIIRNTDDHNKTILRAQAQAAQEVKQEREEQERKERRARAEEAVAAERTRRLMGGGRKNDSDRWDRSRNLDRKRKERGWERRDEGGSSTTEWRRESEERRRTRQPHSRERIKGDDIRSSRRGGVDGVSTSTQHNRKDEDNYRRHSRSRPGSRDREPSHRRRRHRSRSASPKRRSRSPDNANRSRPSKRSEASPDSILGRQPHLKSRKSRHPSDSPEPLDREVELRQKLKAKHQAEEETELAPRSRNRSRSPTYLPSTSVRLASPKPTSSSSRTARSPSPSGMLQSPPLPPSQLPSKMDKYFEESYDPRLDVAPLSSAPKVPATGLIDNSEFEGWDAMLELIRIRREDKEEKKQMERMGIGKDKKDKKGKKVEFTGVNDRWRGGSESIMEIEYKKKGSVREWDMGKEGF